MKALTLALTAAVMLLSACGADGEPEQPAARDTPGLSLTGTASGGLRGSL